jgi:hypothetical protein
MSEINKEALYEQLKTREPKFADAISIYLTIQSVKENLLRYSEWLESNGASIIYADFEGQSPFWEAKYNNKVCYLVLNGLDNICIMLKVSFTDEAQAVMRENNLQDVILNNLQYCSRKDGVHCGNCHLPHNVAGVDELIFGKVVKNLCCGQFISFENPNNETIVGIKKLLEL